MRKPVHENEEAYRAFGQRFRDALDKTGKTQRELSDETGIEEVSISRYVNGTRIPHPILLAKIIPYLGVSADYLLFGRQPEEDGGERNVNVKKAVEQIELCRDSWVGFDKDHYSSEEILGLIKGVYDECITIIREECRR